MPLDARSGGSAPYENQSTSLLSRQPFVPYNQIPRLQDDWGDIFRHLERRLAGLRTWRWTWWDTWMSLGEFFLPRRAKAWIIANAYNRGRWLNSSIVDSTGNMAALTCASGMWSGLTNPARPWFSFEPAVSLLPVDELPADVRDWLTDSRVRVDAVLHGSNFYQIMAQFFQDLTVFGTSPVICYEDPETVVNFTLPCIGEYFLGASSRQRVNTLYREFVLTTLQIVEMFGITNCPQVVQSMYRQGGGYWDQEFIVAHAVEPNAPIQGRNGREIRGVPSKYAYREFYWLRGRQEGYPLSRRGFFEKPFSAGRWTTVSNDPYGRGPGMDGLGDQKQLQLETRRKAEFLEKGIRPPMIADPSMKNEPASIMPGMVTFVNTTSGNAGFKPAFEVQAIWLQHMTADIKDVAARLKEVFYVPNFMAITQMQGVQPRNELELSKRDLERLQVLGPVIDNTEGMLSEQIQRVVSIMQRKGLLKPLPPALQGVPLKIAYKSIMRMAQRASESVAMKDGFATMGSMSAAAKNAGTPDPLRRINIDRSAQRYLILNDFPLDCIYSDEEVAQHDQMRLQEAEQAKQQQMMSELSDPAVKAADVLSKTPVQGDSLLNSILTGATG